MKNYTKVFCALLISLGIGFSALASASEELGKTIKEIQIGAAGSITVTVNNPGPSAVNADCDGSYGSMLIVHDAPARSVWLSLLLVAKLTQTPINITFDELTTNHICPIELVKMP